MRFLTVICIIFAKWESCVSPFLCPFGSQSHVVRKCPEASYYADPGKGARWALGTCTALGAWVPGLVLSFSSWVNMGKELDFS